jgi:hypothetical protein
MEELSKIYKQMGEKFINELFNNYVIVTEKLSGSSFSFQRSGNGLSFYKGSSDKPISLIDRTLMMYYEKPIRHIESISKSVLTNIPENWRFCFQYFVNNNPIVVEYDNLPMNGLVLTHILVLTASGKTESIIDDPRVILDWSNILQVSPMIPIFSGYLSQKQKERIRNFISTPKEDHQEIFRTSSFAEFIIDILNPELETTLLQKNLKKPIDSIVFKFYRNNLSQTYSAKMVDPYTMNLMKSKEPIELRKAPADINEILLLDLLSFIEERGLRSSQLFSQTPNERYIELISSIFNDYVTKKGGDIKNLQIEKAKFVKGPEFDLNLDMIKNSTTQDLLNKSEVNRDLFKIMLGSFRKLRDPNKVGNILTPSVIGDFNKMVKKIKDETDKEVDTSFKTFNDYVSAKNESLNEKTVEELIMEEKVLRFNEFVNLGKIDIFEARGFSKKDLDKIWQDLYKTNLKSDNIVNQNSWETLRAGFGLNDGTAEKNIKDFLKTVGLTENTYVISTIGPGEFDREVGKQLSGEFITYKITFIQPTETNFGQSFSKGQSIYIANRLKISKKSGMVGVTGRKDLTPDKMGLAGITYKSSTDLISKVSTYLNSSTEIPDNYKDFILACSNLIADDSSNRNKFKDFNELSSSDVTLTYNIKSSIFEGIDDIFINNFQNDYGEVLGPIMLFNTLNQYGVGLSYPSASNEKLVDFYFDDFKVSSKGGGGGTPSGDTIVQLIYAAYKQGKLNFTESDEQDFLNNFILKWVNPDKFDKKSNTYNNVITLANINLYNNKNSGYFYLLNTAKIQPSFVTRENLINFLDELSNDEIEFTKFLSTLFQRTGFSTSKSDLKSYYNDYLNKKTSNNSDRIGYVFYPIMVEVTKILNEKYSVLLTFFAQKVTEVKQIYLDIYVSKGVFKFTCKPFKKSQFLFEQKGSINNPFNANIGIKIKK